LKKALFLPLFVLFLFFSNAKGEAVQDINFSQELEVEALEEVEEEIPTTEKKPETTLEEQVEPQSEQPPIQSTEKLIYLKAKIPERNLYVNEVVEIEFEAILLGENPSSFNLSTSGGKDITVVGEGEKWENLGDNKFKNTIYIKLNSETPELPEMKLYVEFSGGIYQEESIPPSRVKAIKLNHPKDSCKVLADGLSVINEKITTYDKNNNILVIEVEGKFANLSDFNIEGIEKQGIETMSMELSIGKIIYYAIIPKKNATFDFQYFNTKLNRFIPISINNEAVDDGVSTQSDIKPRQTYEMYKIIFVSLVLLLILYFWLKNRGWFLFILMIPLAVYLFGLLQPQKEITVKSGARVSILPTENSTIFYVLGGDTKLKALSKRGEFYKIEIDNNKIGWVKASDVR